MQLRQTIFMLSVSLVCSTLQPVNSQDSCPVGKYGVGPVACELDCPAFCADDMCDIRSGICTNDCKPDHVGDRCNTFTRCKNISGDPRGQPGLMNNRPGNYLNLFINLTIPYSGKVSFLQYYAMESKFVIVAFWRQKSRNGDSYTYKLVNKIRFRSQVGYEERDVSTENVMVEAGDAIGIHYPQSNNDGRAIYYQREDDAPVDGISNSDLYAVINPADRDDGWDSGYEFTGSATQYLKTPSLRVFIECLEGCAADTYQADNGSCVSCSQSCKDGLACDPPTGFCPAGCSSGYQANYCQAECDGGTYGENCDNTCNTCKNQACDRMHGDCNNGCVAGYRGFKCDQVCEQGSFGVDCNSTCSTHCRDVMCHHITGLCQCENGGSGLLCTKSSSNQGGSSGSDSLPIIIGAAAGALVVVVIIALVIIVMCRRKRRSPAEKYKSEAVIRTADGETDNGISSELSLGPKPDVAYTNNNDGIKHEYANDISNKIAVKDLIAHVIREKSENENQPFKDEYISIPSNQTEKWDFSSQKELKSKNRFKNILPYDHNRVKLSMKENDPLSTYINASFLPNYEREDAFIASSGPTKTTIGDFWRMAWEYNTKCIVMVTNLIENMSIKCEQYWPPNLAEICTYGNISVTLQTEEKWIDFEIRIFVVSKDGEERHILHLMYTGWPDHGVPEHASGILRIRKRMLEYQGNALNPIIIHCSAGIGRTGTFIALDHLINQGKKEGFVDVYALINRLRSYRVNMVQTKEQYAFIYEVLCECLGFGDTAVECANFKSKYDDESRMSEGTNDSLMQQKYELLEKLKPKFYEDEYDEATNSQNKSKNRDQLVLPAEKHRVYLMNEENGRNIYINAVPVNGYRRQEEYIATQVPLKSTREEFWMLLLAKKCATIVCLEDSTDGTMWYPGPEGPMVFQSAEVRHKATKMEADVIQHHLCISQKEAPPTEYANVDSVAKQDNSESEYANVETAKVVHHLRLFYLPAWSQTELKERNSTSLVNLLTQVRTWENENKNPGPAVVICLNGSSESGIYIASSNLMDMALTDQEVDLFQVVKEIRTTRPQFINSVKQYDFLHSFVLSLLKSPNYLPRQQNSVRSSSV